MRSRKAGLRPEGSLRGRPPFGRRVGGGLLAFARRRRGACPDHTPTIFFACRKTKWTASAWSAPRRPKPAPRETKCAAFRGAATRPKAAASARRAA